MGKKKSTTKTRRSPKTAVALRKNKSNDNLLIELRTEELPPKSLERLSLAFAGGIYASLKEQGFLAADSVQQVFATPRRLAVLISQVLPKQPDRMVERKGPAVSGGVGADGQPSPALLGFAKSCGVDADKLQKRSGDKGEYFVYSFKQKGEGLAQHLAAIVETSLKKLPVAKLMRWGDKDVQFVRPVHGLIMLHGKKVVAGEVLGLKSGNKTLGHRFLGEEGWIKILSAENYAKTLEKAGKTIVDFKTRREIIKAEIGKIEREFDTRIDMESQVQPGHMFPGTGSLTDTENAKFYGGGGALLNEVTALTEYPKVYMGKFESIFLDVPLECLTITMKYHQKYFPVFGRDAKLLPQFVIISNMETKNTKHIIHGNERVLRARLSDAKFFFEQDKKTKLKDRVQRLDKVVYHNKLGSQLERVERIQKLAGEVAGLLNANKEHAQLAAYLCKADLLSDVVGEFPELQGVMGKYYALNDGENEIVASAIEGHYRPRFAGDGLPDGKVACSVALADKLDTLVGIYGVGLVPTGDKDPFGLRRQALGVIRILMESKNFPSVDILELLQLARGHFPSGVVADSVAQDLYGFMLDRLKPYLREKGFLPDEIDAVLSLNPTRLDQVIQRLEALQIFRGMPEAAALAAANKRIHNILKQAGGDAKAQTVESGLLIEDAEKALAERLAVVATQVAPLFAAGKYTDALKHLAQLRDPVDAFFDKVMVMADDEKLRRSRLALLHQIRQLFLQAADISRLQS